MKLITISLLIISFLASCKKTNETSPTSGIQPTYFVFNGQIGINDNSTFISSDNNLILTGNYGGNISVLKITRSGTQLWRKDFAAGTYSTASGIIETNSTELFICGFTSRNYSTSKKDILLIKTNSIGDTIWSKTYGGLESEYGSNIILTADGNLLISGKTESFGAGTFGDIYLIKVNTNGDTLWTKSYADPDQEIPFHLMETQNGEFLVTGTNEDNNTPKQLYLLKVSSSGNQLWNTKIGSSTFKWGYSTIELSNGDLMTCGQHTASDGYTQVLLVRTDNFGNVIWEKEFGENNLSEQGYSIKQNIDGTFIITGSSYDINTMKTDIILVKVDQNGNQLWLKKFGSGMNDDGVNLIKDSNGDNIITGNYNGSIFMTKSDSNGIFK